MSIKIKEKIKNDLVNILDEKRYEHTLSVVESAIYLCKKYNCDENKAEIAALLHDIAKQIDLETENSYIKKYNIKFDKITKSSRQLHHSIIARYIAEDRYGINDEDILNSVEFHTTGRKKMSLLEKIICLADYIEKFRYFPEVEKIRELANSDLDYALFYALNGTIVELAKNNKLIHPNTIKARNELLSHLSNI